MELAHAAYVYTQNLVSVMSEQLAALKEMAPFAEMISKAGDLYMPSAPPMSPLTTSYFTCWALFDACVGPADETIGTTILEFAAAFGIHNERLRLIRLMQESRMGLYIHQGKEGRLAVLKDLVTGAVCRAIVPTGYRGKKGELWYARVLPPPIHGSAEHIVFTTPYIVLHPGPRRLAGVLRPHVFRNGARRRLRTPHEIRSNAGILERFRFRGLRELPGGGHISCRPSRRPREPAALRSEWLGLWR